MRLLTLDIRSFRSHADTSLQLGDGVTLIHGRNGTGKTNILEAIHYLCLTKSFLSSSDSDCLRFDAAHFELEADLQSDAAQPAQAVRVYYSEAEGKNVFINRAPLESFSQIVGEFPCIALSPADIALTQGSPQDRRKFLDATVSQTNKAYLADLVTYRRVLTQRNKLLSELRFRKNSASQLDAWTESLINLSASIIEKRLSFTAEFASYIQKAYSLFSSFEEVPSLRYDSELVLPEQISRESLTAALTQKFRLLSDEEIRRGITLSGPHRDDLEFKINGVSLRKYASQGQHKTFIICLRLAQHFYITALLGERPVFLLDDVFSELDRDRVDNLIELLRPLGQSVITTTERREFEAIRYINTSGLFESKL